MSELDLDTLQRWAATAPDSGVLLHVSDALALIALAREAVAQRVRMDAAREEVRLADIVLPVKVDADGSVDGICVPADPWCAAAIVAALNLLIEEKTDG